MTSPARAAAGALAALNARHPWNHNDHFHGWVLANLPDPCVRALDVGCGRGGLLAALAEHVEQVVGVDVDPGMRAEAGRRCAGMAGVQVTGRPWPEVEGPVDVVTMVAVLHHLDVPGALRQVRRLLRPGGRFLAVGLAPPVSVTDHAWELASTVTNPLIGYVTHPGPARGPGAAVAAAPAVPLREPTLSFDALRRVLARELPAATIRHRLGFRHTIAWTKPPDPDARG